MDYWNLNFQGVSFLTAYSVDLQGVSLSTVSLRPCRVYPFRHHHCRREGCTLYGCTTLRHQQWGHVRCIVYLSTPLALCMCKLCPFTLCLQRWRRGTVSLSTLLKGFLNAGMPDCPESGQSGSGMGKNSDAATSPVPDKGDLGRYQNAAVLDRCRNTNASGIGLSADTQLRSLQCNEYSYSPV